MRAKNAMRPTYIAEKWRFSKYKEEGSGEESGMPPTEIDSHTYRASGDDMLSTRETVRYRSKFLRGRLTS